MAWPDSLSSDLPPPRGDEPANLRQDIADELADHLTSSAAVERARGADDATARQAALDRFGDPTAVARQLWLEAMKGPIMRQRTLMAAAALLVLGVFAANGLAWMAFQQLRESNAALVAQLAAANNKPELGKFADLTVKLVSDDATGAPIEGCSISLQGHAAVTGTGERSPQMLLNEETNAQGTARFAPIAPGNYQLFLRTPSGWHLERGLSLLARPWTETIQVPSSPPEAVKLDLEFLWPEELRDQNLAFYLHFSGESTSFVGNRPWSIPSQAFSRLFTFKDGVPIVEMVSSSGVQPAVEPALVYPGLVRVTAQVLDQRSRGDSNEGLPQYPSLLELESDNYFKAAEFSPQPGKDNRWRIALSAQGIKRVHEALAQLKPATESE